MNQKLISILIPNYNKVEYIEDTFQSIVNQTYTNWECIIVDDHSTDGSWELLQKFVKSDSRFRLFKRPDSLPKGGNTCRNFAFSKAKGEYIQWFDSDDLMLPNFLLDKAKVLDQNPEFPFVASKAEIKFADDFIGTKSFMQNIESDDVISDYLRFRILFLPGGPLFRRFVFEEVGLFHPELKKHQEWELFFRVILRFPIWGVVKKKGFVYFINNNSITARMADTKKHVKAEIKAIQTALDAASNPLIALAPSKTRQYFLLRYLRFSLVHQMVGPAIWFTKRLIQEVIQPQSVEMIPENN